MVYSARNAGWTSPAAAGRKSSPRARIALQLTSRKPSFGKLALAHNGPLIDAVLLDDLAVMEHVKLLRRILAREEHDRLLAAGVVGHEVGHVVDLVADHDPAVRLRGVLGHLSL